jgi:hypothetical protein
MAGGVAQVVENFPRKKQAMNSNTTIAKRTTIGIK